jgi:2-hydroxy-3-keto-5-methylthiopentenyl-1-phosphate phosphatase
VKVISNTTERELHVGDTYLMLNKEFKESKTMLLKPNWTDNKSSFRAIPFKEVLAELERQYSIEIIHENTNINRLFTGGFVHGNLENALISITEPMNITYELSTNNLVVVHGNKK